MKKETIAEGVIRLSENFNFKFEDIYLHMIYDALYSKFPDLDDTFIKIIRRFLLNVTKEQWDSKYGYNGKPTVADWIALMKNNIKLQISDVRNKFAPSDLGISEEQYNSWFSAIDMVIENDTLRISSNKIFLLEYIQRNFFGNLRLLCGGKVKKIEWRCNNACELEYLKH